MVKISTLFSEIENSIGGRPKKPKKVRLSFYLTEKESLQLKELSLSEDRSVSIIVRELVQNKIIDQ